MASSTTGSCQLPNTDEPTKPFTVINFQNTLKLSPTNYITWLNQIQSLLIGHGLLSYVDGSLKAPSKTITTNDQSSPNPAYNTWLRQDNLLKGGLIGTLSPPVASLVTRAVTSRDVWKTLEDTYANPSRAPVLNFDDLLKLVKAIQNDYKSRGQITGTFTSSGDVSTTATAATAANDIAPANDASNATNGGAAGTDAAVNAGGDTATFKFNSIESKGKNYKRAVEMLYTDVIYIEKNIKTLEQKSDHSKRAGVLLQFLVDATKRRTAADFTGNEVNLDKLLQIIAKIKLWVPPTLPKDDSAKTNAKEEESPFVSRMEKDKAATDIVEQLFGLRCNQWGMDGLLTSYSNLTMAEKLSLLCFSAFKCEIDKIYDNDKINGDEDEDKTFKSLEISKSLEIKKKILIHWWLAEGFIHLHRQELISDPAITQSPAPAPTPTPTPTPNPNPNPIPTPPPDPAVSQPPNVKPPPDPENATVEEIGEHILKVLIDKGFIEPITKKARESSRVTMHPFVHSFVTALAKRAGFFDFSSKDGRLTPSFGLSQRACLVKSADKMSSCKLWESHTDDRNKLKRFAAVQTLFNVNEPIIDIKPEWFSRMTNLVVLHLGSWRSETKEHIEVEDTKFLEDVKLMGKLKLFSLQGVSTIMKLTDSVCKLENLVILDLRECHNLEELPAGIGLLRSLTHLDLTNCHLLTKLPKGISLLLNLEVLKGFVIYEQPSDSKQKKDCPLGRCWRKAKGCVIHEVFRMKNKEVCTLKDLENLEKLRHLTLVVNIDKFPNKEEVQVFRNMEKLEKLKISWEKSFKKGPNEQSNQGGSEAPNEQSNQGGSEAPNDQSNQGCSGCLNLTCCKQSRKKGAEEAPNEQSNQGGSEAPKEQSNQGGNEAPKETSNQGGSEAPKETSNQGGSAAPKQTSNKGDSGCLNLICCKLSREEGPEKAKNDDLGRIKKLELWCYPNKDAPKNWLHPNQLTTLEKLYIKGGQLHKVPGDSGTDQIPWKTVTTLRLKYLPNLKISWLNLKDMFPKMTYLEKLECKKLEYFPCDQEGVWQTW